MSQKRARAEQLELQFPPSSHVDGLYKDRIHNSRAGVTFGRKWNGKWSEQTVPYDQVAEIARSFARVEDTYIAQNPVYGRRRIVNLAGLNAAYVDLDCYKISALSVFSPEQIASQVRSHLDDLNVPQPTEIIFSGRGLQVIWLFDVMVPARAISRWKAVQQTLCAALKTFGADRGALDAARVLRLVGTSHSVNGEIVRPLMGNTFSHTHCFDEFADQVLPFTRAEIHHLQTEREKRRQHFIAREEAKNGNLAQFSGAQLWADRQADLLKLNELRCFEHLLPSGWKNTFMFLNAIALSHSGTPQTMVREMNELGRKLGGWNDAETRSCFISAFKRAQMAERGQTVLFNGEQVDARYRFKNSTLISWCGITGAEMVEMKTIISPDEKRRRDRDKKREMRGSNEKKLGRKYMVQAAKDLAAEGKTQAEIAAYFGRSQQTISKWLK